MLPRKLLLLEKSRSFSARPAAPALVVGDALLTNGNTETGDPPTSWTATNATLDGVADERTGGAGSQSLSVARSGNDVCFAYQNFTTVAGGWYKLTGWARNVDATNAKITGLNYIGEVGTVAGTSWTLLSRVGRATGTAEQVRLVATVASLADGTSARFDDISAIALPFDQTGALKYVGDAGQHDNNYVCAPTVSAGYHAGIVCHANSATAPTYCLYAYIDITAAKAYFLKIEAGVTTELAAGGTAITYVAGAKLEIRSVGNTHSLYYNGAIVGTAQTVAMSSLYGTHVHGFQTNASDSLGTCSFRKTG